MLIKGNEINLPSLHDLSAHGWGHLTVPCPASLKCISPKNIKEQADFLDWFTEGSCSVRGYQTTSEG